MAAHDVLILNETVPQIQEPQVGDTYNFPRAAHFQGAITTDSTIDGVDLAAVAALGATATQPGDNLSTLVNDIIASQAEAEAGADNTKMMTPLRVAQAIAVLAAGLQNKLDATTIPVGTNDDSEGYSVGSFWIDVTNDEAWRCVDATTNLAIWVKTTLQTSDLATVALSGDSDDLVEGSVNLLMTVAERAKLTAIEAGATADQTGAEIKAAYEAEADTNAYTDAEKAKLASLTTDVFTTSITAWPTGGQANATQLDEGISVITTVGSDGDSVKLPAAVANKRCVVMNQGANHANLFPASGDQIADNSVDAAITIGSHYSIQLIAIDNTTWIQL